MTRLEMHRAEVRGRQHTDTREFVSADDRMRYVMNAIASRCWSVKEMWEETKYVAGYPFRMYCVKLVSIC